MSKQEKIREEVVHRIYIMARDDLPLGETVDGFLSYLHSQGVVVKVKCPDCSWSQFVGEESVGMTPCYRCNSTGYIVEPLID